MSRVSLLLVGLAAGAAGVLWGQQPVLPAVLATPGTPSQTLYGQFNGSLVRSLDLGATWTPMYLLDPGSVQPPATAIIIDPVNKDIVYLATTAGAGMLWKSTDAGGTWARANRGLPTTGAPSDYFRAYKEGDLVYLYLKAGTDIYRSSDHGGLWTLIGTLPRSAGPMDQAPTERTRFYFADRDTLQVYLSLDESHTWSPNGKVINGTVEGVHAFALSVVQTDSERLFVSVTGPGFGAGAYFSPNAGATFFDQSTYNLGAFSKVYTPPVGTYYAPTANGIGFYRSFNQGILWDPVRTNPNDAISLQTIDPIAPNIIYGLQSGARQALVRSVDSGQIFTPITATLSPTLAKPESIKVQLVQGAPYVQSFSVQTLEDRDRHLPATLTSDQTWLKLASVGGSTPIDDSLTIDSSTLVPGTYRATVTISAPQTFNKSVTFTVDLTVVGKGTQGPQYFISTLAGNGNTNETQSSGPVLSLALGATRALEFDRDGRLWISAGNRLWRATADLKQLDLMAGTGVAGSTGDGFAPTLAQIQDPESMAFDPQGLPHFTEYPTARVRNITNSALRTDVEFARFNFATGSHVVLIDDINRLVLFNPDGMLRYDGNKLLLITPFTFSDPYGAVSDGSGGYYVSDRGRHLIYQVTSGGVVNTIAGRGQAGFGGDGGPATLAWFNQPSGLARGTDGTLYVADSGNQRIRAIGTDGKIRTLAGSGLTGFAGDGDTADFASLNSPADVIMGADQRIYIADSGNNRVRVLELMDVQPPPPPPPPPPTGPKANGMARGGAAGSPLAQGGLFSLFGENLANTTLKTDAIPWPRTLEGVTVTINGIQAPLYFVSPTQINGQIPFEIAPGEATVLVAFGGNTSDPLKFQVAAASPGVLLGGDGTQAIAVNQDGSINSDTATAKPDDIVVIYLSGIGMPDQVVQTGEASPASPLARANLPYTIKVGGVTAEVLYLGYTPGFPALVQANVKIPAVGAGKRALVITVNGVDSNASNLSIGNR